MGTSASAPYVALVSKFWVAEDVITRSRTASGHVVVGFAAGGPTNILARLVGHDCRSGSVSSSSLRTGRELAGRCFSACPLHAA